MGRQERETKERVKRERETEGRKKLKKGRGVRSKDTKRGKK